MKGGGQDMTFFEVYDRWLDKHKAEIKQSTVATYYSLGNTFTRIIDSDADICSLDADVMKACLERFRDTGASNHYIADLIRVFRMVMRYAGEDLGISNLPSIDWK